MGFPNIDLRPRDVNQAVSLTYHSPVTTAFRPR